MYTNVPPMSGIACLECLQCLECLVEMMSYRWHSPKQRPMPRVSGCLAVWLSGVSAVPRATVSLSVLSVCHLLSSTGEVVLHLQNCPPADLGAPSTSSTTTTATTTTTLFLSCVRPPTPPLAVSINASFHPLTTRSSHSSHSNHAAWRRSLTTACFISRIHSDGA
jgi:hypothetical protein